MAWSRKYLTDAELHISDSEDGLDNSGAETEEVEIPLDEPLEEFEIQELPFEFDNVVELP